MTRITDMQHYGKHLYGLHKSIRGQCISAVTVAMRTVTLIQYTSFVSFFYWCLAVYGKILTGTISKLIRFDGKERKKRPYQPP